MSKVTKASFSESKIIEFPRVVFVSLRTGQAVFRCADIFNPCLTNMKKSQKSERVMVRLSPEEKAKLSAYAERKGQTESWIIREYIRRLPSLPKPQVLPAIEQPLNLPVARVAEPEPLLIEDIEDLRSS